MRPASSSLLKYCLLPGLLPRVRDLAGSGFARLAYVMALAFQSSRLLPTGHAYVIPGNIGKFGIRHVLSAARKNLVHTRGNADQIILYYSMLAGLFMVGFQVFLFGLTVLSGKAFAADSGGGLGGFFKTLLGSSGNSGQTIDHSAFKAEYFDDRFKDKDLAYNMLDKVFCFRDKNDLTYFAGLKPNDAGGCATPFHDALHMTLNFYNTAILVVAGIILLYYIVAVVAETAQSGTPFGKRFTHAWVPVRLILAAALLTPYGGFSPDQSGDEKVRIGLNGAQHIMLQTAKFGSAMASKAWLSFNGVTVGADRAIGSGDGQLANTYTPAGLASTLVTKPNISEFNSLLEYALLAHTCRQAEHFMNNRPEESLKAYQISGKQSWPLPQKLDDALKNIRTDTANEVSIGKRKDQESVIRIAIGEKSEYNEEYEGNVRPICGVVTFRMTAGTDRDAAYRMQESYYQLIKNMMDDPYYDEDGYNVSQLVLPIEGKDPNVRLPMGVVDAYPNLRTYLQKEYIDYYKKQLTSELVATQENEIMADQAKFLNAMVPMGWAAAGVWYNRIAKSNGHLVAAVYNMPTVSRYPEVMEYVVSQKKGSDKAIGGNDKFSPYLASGKAITFQKPGDLYVALALHHAQTYWSGFRQEKAKDGPVIEAIRSLVGEDGLAKLNALSGTGGLIKMGQDTDVHPLAQIAGIGRSLIEASAYKLGAYAASMGISVLADFWKKDGEISKLSSDVGKVARQFGMIALVLGFMLYYVIPLLPFVYFFFAVSVWVKGLFEAMVGAPLWALAFIRISGEGIPGQYAMQGFFMMLEIFIRPVLTVLGLVASIVIFSAQVKVLHGIWPEIRAAVASAEGETAGMLTAISSVVDSFFFLIIYAVIVYICGIVSFKMIDLIPNNVMRWMSGAMRGFDHYATEGTGLVSMAHKGGQQLMNESSGLLQKLLGK